MSEHNGRDFRLDVTNSIIEMMEKGTAPWQKPWDKDKGMSAMNIPHNGITGRHYNGGNLLYLMAVSMKKGYDDPRWITYNQARENSWIVKKGEKGTFVEYWQFQKEIQRPNQETGVIEKVKVDLQHPFVKYFCVFNGNQIEGIPQLQKKDLEWKPEDAADRILLNSKAEILHDQIDRAFYSPAKDSIHLPNKLAFDNSIDYYSTALHELGHWTGHESRLARPGITGRHEFGSQEYAKEELRAELSSLFISVETGIHHDPSKNASYLNSWIKVLQNDKNELFRASKDASQITDFVMGFNKEIKVEKNIESDKEYTNGVSIVGSRSPDLGFGF